MIVDDISASPSPSVPASWPRRIRDVLALLPKIIVTALLVLAITDMLAGVFLRYVMVEITDFLDLDPVNFFWVEEVGELSLTWLTISVPP